MDRRELADIGLSPCDLRDVSALPLDRDPTALLARRAHERRRNAFEMPAFPGRTPSPFGRRWREAPDEGRRARERAYAHKASV
jgi:hypothetical protein